MYENRMLIDGKWKKGTNGHLIEVENPATEEIFEAVPAASEQEIEKAIEAAHKAFPHWRSLSCEKRSEYLLKASELVYQREKNIAELMTKEQGKPLNEARGEVKKGAEILRYYAEEGKRIVGRVISGYDSTTTSYVIYEPVGVAAAISPWNYPVELVAWKIGAALASGCTIIVKPPSETPLSPLNFIKCLIDSGIPDGVINVIFGKGNFIGPKLISNPLVKKVAFTGSTEVGKEVLILSAKYLKKVSLELGGQCPLIVSDKCNLSEAVKGATRRTFRNMGQICIAINRIYTHKSIFNDFLEAFIQSVSKLTIANGLKKPDADLGPMANKRGLNKTKRHIEDALSRGARIVYGGKKPEGSEYKKGYFFQPTILTNVNHDMLVMKEETFGPLVGVMPYNSINEVIHFANSTKYGLASYVYTNDLNEADEFINKLESGNVAINNPDAGVINAPYGGFKESGMGYEHGPDGIMEYVRAKHIRVRYFNRYKES